MSGLSESEIRLSRLAAAITAASQEVRRLSKRAGGLEESAEHMLSELSATSPNTQVYREQLRTMVKSAKETLKEAGSVARTARGIQVPASAAVTDDEEMLRVHSTLRQMESSLEGIGGRLAELARRQSQAAAIDATLAEARSALFTLETEVRSHRQVLESWAPKEAKRLLTDIASLSLAVKSKASGVPEPTIRDRGNDELLSEAAALGESLAPLVDRTEKLQAAQDQRLYILKGLRDVCSSLGFQELSRPAYEGGPERLDTPVVFKVDTGKGTITFRLGLDGRVLSDSGMDSVFCPTEFDNLSALLEEEYGLQSQFEHEDVQADPKRIQKEAAQTPKGAFKSLDDRV